MRAAQAVRTRWRRLGHRTRTAVAVGTVAVLVAGAASAGAAYDQGSADRATATAPASKPEPEPWPSITTPGGIRRQLGDWSGYLPGAYQHLDRVLVITPLWNGLGYRFVLTGIPAKSQRCSVLFGELRTVPAWGRTWVPLSATGCGPLLVGIEPARNVDGDGHPYGAVTAIEVTGIDADGRADPSDATTRNPAYLRLTPDPTEPVRCLGGGFAPCGENDKAHVTAAASTCVPSPPSLTVCIDAVSTLNSKEN